MLDLTQIQSYFPKELWPYKRNMLREYLQYKMLDAVFRSPHAAELAFMGGTCIHIVHGSPRFSEDLDFDNLDLEPKQFKALAGQVKRALELEGYTVEVKSTFRNAFRARIRFADILHESGLSGHRDEKLLIEIDTEPQRFEYSAEKVILNKFGVFTRINTVPADILLAQKLLCVFTRKRPMGRDFFDVVFLHGKTTPNEEYLSRKLGISGKRELKERLLRRCDELDLGALARDLAPLVHHGEQATRVLLFRDYIAEAF